MVLRRYVSLGLTLIALITPDAFAQKPVPSHSEISLERFAALSANPEIGTCALGSAARDLDVGNVRARLYNNGALFWKQTGNTYTVPKNGIANAIFTMGLWVGGYDTDSTLRFAGSDYGPFEYWPGPLDAQGDPPSDCSQFDRIWSVRRSDIESYDQGGQATADLLDWPRVLGAPTVDGDGDPSNYNLAGGDRPALYGDQIAWWVMNDVGNVKQSSQSEPLGLEVRVTAHAFAMTPGSDASSAYTNTTIYDYELIYRGDGPLAETRIGLFLDTDLGDGGDDYVGVDTVLALAYTYNGDATDGGVAGYGSTPPALGVQLLATPDRPGQRGWMHTFLTYIGDRNSPRGHPDLSAGDGYDYLGAIWKDGQPVTFSGIGRDTGSKTRRMYPGNGSTREYWSEENTNNQGNRNTPGDRRSVIGTAPITLMPGETYRLSFALVWSQSVNRLASLAQLRFDSIFIRGREEDRIAQMVSTERGQRSADAFTLLGIHPNPATAAATFSVAAASSGTLRLSVYDLLGRRIASETARAAAGSTTRMHAEVGALPAGVYLYRLEALGAATPWSTTGQFVVAR